MNVKAFTIFLLLLSMTVTARRPRHEDSRCDDCDDDRDVRDLGGLIPIVAVILLCFAVYRFRKRYQREHEHDDVEEEYIVGLMQAREDSIMI